MIREIAVLIRKNKSLREEVEADITAALLGFSLAKSVTDGKVLEEALMMPAVQIKVEGGYKNVMSVSVPSIKILSEETKNIFPYSFLSVSGELNESIKTVSHLMPKLLLLAETEKACDMLADEIEKNKRRVNALEYVMIPELEAAIKTITMKLEENERSGIVRMMKVKEIIEARNSEEKY